MNFGINVRLGFNICLNHNCTIFDTCIVSIESRTLVGPNVFIHSATHPLDPQLRDGNRGSETGKEIHGGDDCWIGGGSIVLPGVTNRRGSTVGAGRVVTKDVSASHVVAGNPARILGKIETQVSKDSSE